MSFCIVIMPGADYFEPPYLDYAMSKPYQLVYLSALAPDVPPTCVAGIVRVARLKNETRQIRSLLVFDGEYFCQYIEGRQNDVATLRDRIRVDVRHTDFQALHEAELEERSEMAVRSLDYALSYDHSLECFKTVRGTEAVELLRNLVSTFDRVPEH